MAQITLNSTGVASSGALVLQSNGTTEQARINTSGNLGIGTTSPAQKLDVYLGSTGTVGQYLRNTTINLLSKIDGTTAAQFGTETSHPLTFITGNTERARIDSSGNVGIGTSSPTSILTIGQGSFTAAGSNTTGMYTGASGAGLVVLTDAFNVSTRVAGTTLFSIGTGGIITSTGTYSNTSAGVANMFVQTDGTFYRGGVSALKYKQNVRDLELIDINKFRAVRYKSKCEFDDQTIDYFGFIADEVDAAGIKELITYGADGEVEGFQYERFTVVLLKELQKQQALITQLTARLDAANL